MSLPLCFRYMSLPTLCTRSFPLLSLHHPLSSFATYNYIIIFPSPHPHFILFAILPLYLIYISSPISIFSRHYLSFSLSFPSFSISSFVCYSWMYFPCLESPSSAIWSASCLGDTQTDLSSFWKTRGPAYWQQYF